MVTHRFINSYSDSSLCYVKHNTSSAVVMFERHALVNRGIHFDVDIVSSLMANFKVMKSLL